MVKRFVGAESLVWGFTRQATRSLYEAVRMLGLSAMHGFGGCGYCERDATRKYVRGETDFDVYKSYHASFQVAAVHWKQLATERPDAKFILPLRPLNDWINSCRSKCRIAQITHGTTGWFWLERYAHYGQLLFDEKVWLARWRDHVNAVTQAFIGTGRLLVINVFEQSDEELWSDLSSFLHVPMPDPIPSFPHKRRIVKIRENYMESMNG